ncbi:MAG: TlpA disulfide reductase family protein [Nitrospirota bacterium]
MIWKKISFTIFITMLMSFLLSCDNKAGVSNGPFAAIGDIAPDFVLQDINGRNVSLSKYRGKVVLLEFWAMWCPPCRATVPELVEIQNRYKSREFVILGVSVDNGQDLIFKLSEFSKNYSINYPVLLGNEKISSSYNVRSIPASFLIDKNGRIINSYIGYIANFESEISEQIDKII